MVYRQVFDYKIYISYTISNTKRNKIYAGDTRCNSNTDYIMEDLKKIAHHIINFD